MARRPHFPAALAATFADLRQALVWEAGELQDQLWRADIDDAATRAADLAALYEGYRSALGVHGVGDDAETYVQAACAVTPGADHVVLFGLYDLNTAQARFASALLQAGADLFVPLPAGWAAATTVLSLPGAAGRAAVRLPAPSPRSDRERLAALWQASAGAGEPLRLAGDGTLGVLSVPDERSEAREAARVVLEAVAAGSPAWDSAVVVPSAGDRERVCAALRAAGLPFACRLPQASDGGRALQRLLDCLAPTAGPPFARRAVIDLLCAAPLRGGGADDRDRSLWLDEARHAGVLAGLQQWSDRVGRRVGELERRVANTEAAAALRTGAAAEEEAPSHAALRARLSAAQTLAVAVASVREACADLPVRQSWSGWCSSLTAAMAALFDEPAASEAADAAASLHSLDVLGEAVDVAAATSVLREGLDAAQTAYGRVGRDGVAVLTPLELRGLSFSTVVFTGLAEGGFPAVGRADPLLGDADRRRLADSLHTRLPLAEDRAAESLLLFAFACEAARDRLVLVTPRTDAATGRPRLPSRLLLQAASLVAGRPVGLDEFLSGDPLRPVWRHISGLPPFREGSSVAWLSPQERDSAVLLALAQSGDRATVAEYLAAVLGGRAEAERRRSAWAASGSPVPGPWDGLLSEPARRRLATAHPLAGELSPTRLERYVGCPFQFFLRDVLHLEAPEDPSEGIEIEPVEYGRLAHLVLQLAYQRLIDAWEALDPGSLKEAAHAAVRDAWELSCNEAEQAGVTGARLAWEVRREILLEDLLESVSRDPVLVAGNGRPLTVEWWFGERGERPVEVRLTDERTARFAGRVDRVDQTPAGVRVIDYKTGAGETERRRIKSGLGAQLPVYQLAAATWLDSGGGQTEAVYRLVTRKGAFEDISLQGSRAEATASVATLVAQVWSLIDRGLFPRSSIDRGCDFCDVGYACGSTAWSRARKREHELVSDLVRLQASGPSAAVSDG